MFDVILADPPWQFKTRSPKGEGRSAKRHYPTMPLEDILALRVPAERNAVLFLWATWPNLQDAFKLIEAWGFSYRTVAWVWVKLNKNGVGFHTGLGYYTRANTEPCLLAVRGRMPVAVHDVQAVLATPVRRHSQKPDEQYPKIERLYPNQRYLELFARQRRPGWSVWGNQVESNIEL